MEYKPKNREWVKNAAIIFLSVLLVLTFFSNTWMNRSLPEVATQFVTNGTITAKVRGTGTVSAVGVTSVKAEQTREIRAVMVKVGQEVKAGDVLFVLGQGEASELEAAEEQLRQLQLSYQSTAVGIVYPSYSVDERRIKAAKEIMENAKKALDKIAEASGRTDEVKELLEKQAIVSEQLEEAEKVRDAERKAYDDLVAAAQEDLTVKAQERDDAQRALTQNGILFLDRLDKLWKFRTATHNVVLYDSGEVKEISPLNAFASASVYAVYPKEHFSAALLTFKTLSSEIGDMPGDGSGEDTGVDMGGDTGSEQGGNTEETPQTPDEEPVTGEIPDEPVVDPVTPSPQPQVSAEEIELMREFQTKQKRVDEAESKLKDIPRSNLDDAQAKVDELRKKYEGYQSEIDLIMSSGLDSEAYLKAKDAYTEAQINYWTLVEALNEKRQADARAQNQAYLTLGDLNAQIERVKKKIQELSGGEENQVLAKSSGTIETVDCAPGDTKLKGDLLCTIEVPDLGYTMSFSVANDQARRLKPGDTATVSNYYWGNQIVATLESIKADPKNPQTNKLLTFEVKGDVSAGTELTISVGQKSANYDIIVPNSAIRSDTNGSFVLAIESKSSPLGNRYMARRVDVKVLAEDDVNSAVTSELKYGDYVITTSNAPVKSGDLVRLADNAS